MRSTTLAAKVPREYRAVRTVCHSASYGIWPATTCGAHREELWRMWFSDRKISKKRDSGGRRRRPIFVVNSRLSSSNKKFLPRAGMPMLGLVAVGAVAVFGWLTVQRVTEILFTGNDDYVVTNVVVRCENPDLKDFVTGTVRKSVGTNLFQVCLRDIRSSLLKTPSIKSVAVTRCLPGTLDIAVAERIPVARLGNIRDDWRCLVVDEEGMAFTLRSRSRAGILPVLTGYGEGKTMPGDILKDRIRDALTLLSFCCTSPVGRQLRLASADIKKEFIDVKLADGPLVSVAWQTDSVDIDGQKREIERRIKMLRIVLGKADRAGVTLQTVDLTHDNFTEYCPTKPRWDK